jgi:hypothetical protein
MYQYQFTVPAVLSKLLYLRFGGDSIPSLSASPLIG